MTEPFCATRTTPSSPRSRPRRTTEKLKWKSSCASRTPSRVSFLTTSTPRGAPSLRASRHYTTLSELSPVHSHSLPPSFVPAAGPLRTPRRLPIREPSCTAGLSREREQRSSLHQVSHSPSPMLNLTRTATLFCDYPCQCWRGFTNASVERR